MNLSPASVWQWGARQAWARALFLLSMICGVSYLLAPFLLAEQIRTYWPVNAVVKALAVSPLALLVWQGLQGKDGKLLSVALLFSSLGDIFLALRNGNYFVFGLLSFLVAHLFFIVLWRRNWSAPLRVTKLQRSVLVLVALYLLVMLWWMLPVPGLSVPVAIYMLVLTAMVMAATMVNATHPWIAIGAILFLLSDSLIALSTFKQVVGGRLAGFLIWSTYYLAQYLMTFGFMLTKTQRKHG